MEPITHLQNAARSPRIVFVLITMFFQLIFSGNAFSESYKVKKLVSELKRTSKISSKFGLLLEIGNEIKGSYPDSALYYFKKAEELVPKMESIRDRQIAQVRLLLGRTSLEVARGNYSTAWELDSIALLRSRVLNNDLLIAQALMSQGSIFYQLSKFERAQKINEEALKLIKSTSDRKTEGKILTNMGTIEFMIGNSRKADSLFRIPLQLAEDSGDEDLLGASLLNIGLLNVYSGNNKTAEEFLKKSIEVYKSIDGKDGLVLCYQNLASLYFGQGNIQKAIEFNLLNYNLSGILGDKIGLAKAKQNLGECYSQLGDYEKAIGYLLSSLDIKIQLADLKGIAATFSSIGHIHYLQGQFKQALEYYRKSLQTNIEIGYAIGIANGYSNVGTILYAQNKQDSALFFFKKSADIYKKNENVNFLANVYLNIGKVYFAQKDYKSALEFYNKAEQIKVEVDDRIGLFDSWLLIASMYFEMADSINGKTFQLSHEMRSALAYANKAYNISVSNNNLPQQLESSGLLKDIYAACNNPDKALYFARKELDLSDSLAQKQQAEALINAEIRWKAEKKQIEIDKLQKEKVLQAKVIEQKAGLTSRLYIIIGAMLLILILVLFVTLLYNKNKETQKFIEYQQHIQEITRLKMQNFNNRLSPHLFFNLLGSVSVGSEDATIMKEKLGKLALLLRTSLENTENTAISLSRELEMVKAYISLQEIRLSYSFTVEFQINETVDLNTMIPVMILQIPVENAIKHGLMPLETEKRLLITIETITKSIVLKVEDNGIGRKNSIGRTTGTGTGLKILLQTISMLNERNNNQITFVIKDIEPQGTEVNIHVPLEYNYAL